MTPDQLAEALRAVHPEADPLAVSADTVADWSEEAGFGSPDDQMLAATLVAWSELVA